MSQKSVSLFEVLPPSGGRKNEEARPSGKATPQPARLSQIEQKELTTGGGRTRVEDIPKPVYTAPVAAEPSSSSRDIEGISVRKKEDHHTLVLICLLALSVLTFVVGYRMGQKNGVALAVQQLQPTQQPTTPRAVNQSTPPARASNPPPVTRPTVDILPTTVKTLNAAQMKAAAPIAPPKMYTLQIQTFGRNQKSSIDDLLSDLRSSGFQAFADYSDGAVFVGRLESSRGQSADQLKNDIARFNWRKRDFSTAYFRRIPNHLLEK